MYRNCLLTSLFGIILLSCEHVEEAQQLSINTPDGVVNVSLIKNRTINYLECRLHDSLTGRWPLRYPVYKFLKGDINNDGQEDVAVGVIKRTRRDTVARKRLFFFALKKNKIIPLWLGSSLGHPLEDFRLVKRDSATLVRSVEHEKNNTYLVAEYEWFGFGLSFRQYLAREITLEEAITVMEH